MDKLGETLFDRLKRANGVMSEADQNRFVEIVDRLDSIGVYHGDPSPLNFLYDDTGVMKIIDFGFGKKLKTGEKSDRNAMFLGFLLKMKEIGIPPEMYSIIKKQVPKPYLEKCGIH